MMRSISCSAATARHALPVTLALSTAVWGMGSANSQVLPAPYKFEYAAKYVCGVVAPTAAANSPVAPGKYYTAVNVHNPSDIPGLRKKFVIALPGEKQGGFISPWVNALLKYDEAFEIDCPDILSHAHPPGTPIPTFAKGFVVIQSQAELDIVAVYTAAATATGPVVTMATERVPKRP